jgi:hypothetical protein
MKDVKQRILWQSSWTFWSPDTSLYIKMFIILISLMSWPYRTSGGCWLLSTIIWVSFSVIRMGVVADKKHWDRSFSELFGFPLEIIISPLFYNYPFPRTPPSFLLACIIHLHPALMMEGAQSSKTRLNDVTVQKTTMWIEWGMGIV